MTQIALTDNQVINVLATSLETASSQLTAQFASMTPSVAWSAITLQKDQPSQQGAPTGPAIYFEKLFDMAYGFPMVSRVHVAAVPPSTQGTFSSTEAQWTETTFQISAQATQDPENLSVPTASDIVNYMKLYMSSRPNLAYLKGQGIGILRPVQIRNPSFKDDRNVFEFNPSFDIVLQYLRSITAVIGATNIVQDQGLYPI